MLLRNQDVPQEVVYLLKKSMISLRKCHDQASTKKSPPFTLYINISRAPLLQVAHPIPMEAAQVAKINSIYKEKCMLL